MDYKLTQKIQEVFEYILTPKLCFKLKDNVLVFKDKILSKNVEDVFFYKNAIIFNLEDRTSKIVNTKTFKEFHLKTLRAINTTTLKNNEWSFVDSSKSNILLIVDLESKKNKIILESYNWEFVVIYNNDVFLYVGNSVNCLSIETGEYLWETDISNFVSSLDGFSYKDERVGGILGISDNKLIITVGTRLLKIDLHNGIITGDTEALSHGKNYSQGPAGFHSYLHLEDEYVYLLKRDRYLRISLITGKLETLWVNSQSDLIIEHVHYDENYAYFMACIGWNLQPEVLGVFDRKNLSIVWQYDQPIYSSQPPQSDGKKLYSLDTSGTLHLFERES